MNLEALFAAGTLLRPDSPNLVDLSIALARLGGAKLAPSDASAKIEAAVGKTEHLVFVLVDGLGMNLVETTDFLRRQTAMELRSVFPSSTAPALTSLATGQRPGRHAVPAWWTHLPRVGATSVILHYAERFEGKPLTIPLSEAFPEPSILPQLTVDVHSFQPAQIVESPYSRYLRGTTGASGYSTFAEAVDSVIRRVQGATKPTYTYVYYPALDAAEHKYGPASPQAKAQLEFIQSELSRLADGLRGKGRLVASADHGQIEVPDSAKSFLAPDDPLLAFLEHPPAGEPRVIMFHAKPGFEPLFRERFPKLPLFTTSELEPLFGPLSAETRARIGTHVAIAIEPSILLYGPPKFHREEAAMRGYHGGLLPGEMRVPLIVA